MSENLGNIFTEGNVSLCVVVLISGHMWSGSTNFNLKKWRWMQNIFYNMRIKAYG